MLCSPSTPTSKYTLRHRQRPAYTSLPALSLLSDPPTTNPRFSRLLGTVLGSPFLTTSDIPLPPPDLDIVDGAISAVPRSFTITRPSSPTPSNTLDTFSIISPSEIPDVFSMSDYPGHSMPPSSSFFFRSPYRSMRPILHAASTPGATLVNTSPNPLKSLLPRIWDALSSPGKTTLIKPLHSSSLGRGGKGKGVLSSSLSGFNYQDLPPLDGEEGELIDDEACFIDVMAVTGIDILSLLPLELSLYIFSNFLDLSSILACLAVSRRWRALAADNGVWRELFLAEAGQEGRGWDINLSRVAIQRDTSRHRGSHIGHALEEWKRQSANLSPQTGGANTGRLASTRMRRSSTAPGTSTARMSSPSILTSHAALYDRSLSLPLAFAPLQLDWRLLYKERLELDKRWVSAEPEVRQIEGHADSVYCLEFDATRIITGSRDKTIKVWSLATGALLGTMKGHAGSVLCLKFDKDWEEKEDEDESDIGEYGGDYRPVSAKRTRRSRVRKKPGFMVSGSSDCSVCVWDLYTSGAESGVFGEKGRVGGEVRGEIRAALKGHSGGVLDLRIDKWWIVSCSKDALIRVWDRHTLELHRTFRGHEGPVNAVGLRSGGKGFGLRGGHVASASGDGKMMLWDIESGERLRTFEGHERGLACIEFKDDLIISGSNDCKIKVWSVSKGECIRTLVGHEMLVRALSFEPRSGRLVSASYDRSVKVWDLKSGKMIRQFKNSHSGQIFDVRFDVGRIVSTSHDQKIVILDFTKGINTSLFV